MKAAWGVTTFSLLFQLVMAPAALAVESWEAKRALMAKRIKESIASLDYLDRVGPSCSDNYTKSQCPKAMPTPPKRSFTGAAKKTLSALEAEVAALAPSAKLADSAVSGEQVNRVDGCAGAGVISVADTNARKQAVDKMAAVFARVNSAISTDLHSLFDSGPVFQKTLKACTSEIAGGFFGALAGMSGKLPSDPHSALEKLFSADSSSPSCPRDAVTVFQKLTGRSSGSAGSQLASLAKEGREYSANLKANSIELARFASAGAKVECKAATDKGPAKAETAARPEKISAAEEKPKVADDKKSAISGAREPGKKTAEEMAEAPPATPGSPEKFTKTSEPVPVETAIDPPVGQRDIAAEGAKPKTQLGGTGKAAIGIAVLGVGAGAAYLIFKKNGSGKSEDTTRAPAENPGSPPSATATVTGSITSTSTATEPAAVSSSDSSTSTNTQTETQTNATVPGSGQ